MMLRLLCLAAVGAVMLPLLRSQHVAGDGMPAAAAAAEKLQLAGGLRLSVWAAEPLLSNGVAFSIDPRGRIYVAETHRWNRSIFDITQKTNWLLADMAFRTVADRVEFLEGQFAALDPELLTRDSELIRRLEDADGDGRAETASVFASGFNSPGDGTAAGVLANGERVYFADIPHLWSFPDPGSRPAAPLTADRNHLLAEGFGVHIGVSGHDLHGLIEGPDGRLYMSFGDRGLSLTNREGIRLDVPDCGGVLRCEPDGRHLEVFCIGLRNPQELAFDDLGELWTVDNDTAGADPCRVLHLVEGGDYGWRTAYQHQAGFGEWVQQELWRGGVDGILPPAGTVSQGPSGLAFHPGTGLGGRWVGTFLHCDFPGGVWSFSVRESGATFVVDRREKFLWGCWPTDVDFGPDGSVYVLDWVAGWGQPGRGRIYRVTPETPDDTTAQVGWVRERLAAGFADIPDDALAPLLGHPDQRIRLGAQRELVRRRSVGVLTATVLEAASRHARLHAVWGLGTLVRSGRIDGLGTLLPVARDPDDRVAGATLELLARAGVAGVGPMLAEQARSDSPVRLARVVRAGRFLEESGDRQDDATWMRIAQAPAGSDLFVRHELVHLLERGRTDEAGIAGWQQHSDPRLRGIAVLALRRAASPRLTRFLSDPDRDVRVAAGRALYDAPVASGMASLAGLVSRIDCPTNLFTRVLAANLRLGTPMHAQMVASFAKRRDLPAWARARALEVLGEWASPPPLDPVTGLWRPAVVSDDDTGASPAAGESAAVSANPLLDRARNAAAALAGRAPLTRVPTLPPDLGRSADFDAGTAVRRNPQPARRAFLRVGDEILNPDTPDEFGIVVPGPPPPVEVQVALLRAAVRLSAKEAAHPFFEKFQDPSTPAELRREIVPALAALIAFETADAVRLALADPDPGVRASALPFLDRLDPGAAATHLAALLPAGVFPGGTGAAPPEAQTVRAVFDAMGRLQGAPTEGLLIRAVEALDDGKLPAEFHLDVLSAAAARAATSAELSRRLHRWTNSVSGEAAPGARLALLTGGDPGRGRAIFFDNPQVQCSRCHQVAGAGGTVGPSLDRIGSLREPTYLLEAITEPNRAYAPGFAPTPGGLSAMPEGLAELLTPLELRDVIAYLRSLTR